MFKQWKKFDLGLGIFTLLAGVFYFISKGAVSQIIFLGMIVASILRIIFVIRHRFFWKIRNRLIFSSLFFVVTPILLVSLFYYNIFHFVIAQFGSVIINSVMKDRIVHIEELANGYIRNSNPQLFLLEAAKYLKLYSNFTAIYWKKNGDSYTPFFKYPDTIKDIKIKPDEFSGFYVLNNKSYHGVIRKNSELAVLIGFEINQEYLDGLFVNSDLKITFRNPNPNSSIPHAAAPDMASPRGTLQGSNNSGTTVTQTDYPTVYEYNYYDFDSVTDSTAQLKHGYFPVSIDADKVISNLFNAVKKSPQGSVRNFIFGLMFGFGFFIVISLYFGFRMVRVITRSIDHLTRGTQKIRNGDFSYRIKTRSGDQLQYLAECFNEMASGVDRLLVDEKEKQRLEEELRIARSIQIKLLPPDSFITDDFEIAAVNIPASEIAGDYFDYFYQAGAYLSILVADVSGKGASAAFYMAELKGVVNHLHRLVISPAQLISECHYSLKSTFDKMTFITMNIVQFRLPDKKFVMARAGHTQAVYFNALEKKCVELHPSGMAIGLSNFNPSKVQEVELPYQKGDILILFSDGLTEIMNQEEEMLGIDRLKHIIIHNSHLTADQIKREILDFSIEFSGEMANRDDLTFILVKVK